MVLLNNLAEKVEDFSVTLIDQVNTEEEISIDIHEKENMDTYACLLDSITESAIGHEQKKVNGIFSLMCCPRYCPSCCFFHPALLLVLFSICEQYLMPIFQFRNSINHSVQA